ncbi:hypothetical protein [Streptomyces sp. NPDC086989]
MTEAEAEAEKRAIDTAYGTTAETSSLGTLHTLHALYALYAENSSEG